MCPYYMLEHLLDLVSTGSIYPLLGIYANIICVWSVGHLDFLVSGTFYVAQASFKLTVLLPLAPQR